MCNEYPNIVLEKDLEAAGYDGIIEENMVFCVESYLGDEAGGEGVKLEEQVLVTERGAEILVPQSLRRSPVGVTGFSAVAALVATR